MPFIPPPPPSQTLAPQSPVRLPNLDALTTVGYRLFADRVGRGRRAVSVDLVAVGPGGVFLLDAHPVEHPSVRDDRLLSSAPGADSIDVTDTTYALGDLGQYVERALVSTGLSPNEVHPVAVVSGMEGPEQLVAGVHVVDELGLLAFVTRHGQRLAPDVVQSIAARCSDILPAVSASDHGTHRADPADVSPAAPGDQTAPDERVHDDQVEMICVESMLPSPLPDWMSMLHPAQAALVRGSFDGPARIHGASGTGKTVVGLHRAVYLARLNPLGRVLVTAPTDLLPCFFEHMMSSLGPDVADRVVCTSVQDIARTVLGSRDLEVRVDEGKAITAFNRAWSQVGRHGALASAPVPVTYWQEEVGLLRGRGVETLEDYDALDRTGREVALSAEVRIAVWELRAAYESALRIAGITDAAGLLLAAIEALRTEPFGTVPGDQPVTAVIADEAHELTRSQARLLHAVAGDGRDSLLLLDDGVAADATAPTLAAAAGIEFGDRAVTLDVPFCTPRPTGDETLHQPARWHGPLHECGPAVVERIHQVLADIGTNYRDIAILAPSRAGVRTALAVLQAAGIPTVDLGAVDPALCRALPPDRTLRGEADRVVVSTIPRVTGLEFKQVLVLGIPDDVAEPDAAAPAGGLARERWMRERRLLRVAVNRARDGVWIGTIPRR